MPNYRYRTPNNMGHGHYVPKQADNFCNICPDPGPVSDEISKMPPAMAYVPWQRWCNLYESEVALSKGTIFIELDKPFRGKGGCCK